MENDNSTDLQCNNDNASLDNPSLGNASLDNASLDNASLDNASFDNTSLGNASLISSSLSHKSSQVWSHFTKDINFKTNKKAFCNYCPSAYICSGGSTSNLAKHLNKYHASKLNLPVNETSIENYFSSTQVNIKI
jgi:BED zinc finger/Pentapeptide repeats (8 copies)